MLVMHKLKSMLWLALCGSIWGIIELIGGDFLYHAEIPLSSVWLAVWAFFILSLARGINDRWGSSTFVAIVAGLFRSINASPFFCHMLGILFLGLAFDLTASLFSSKKWRTNLQKSLVGVLSAYGGYALFAFVITYIIQYEYWIGEGLSKVVNHIFVGGSLAALFASVVVPIGYNVGKRGEVFLATRPQWSHSLGVFLLFLIWSLKILVG